MFNMTRKTKKVIENIFMILIILAAIAFISYNLKVSSQVENTHMQILQDKNNGMVNTYKDIEPTKMISDTKLVCLSGSINSQTVFTNKNNIEDECLFHWVHQKWDDLNFRAITTNNVYNYTFTFNIKTLVIDSMGENTVIKINPTEIKLDTCSRDNDKSSFSVETEMLASEFTQSEIDTINERCRTLTNKSIEENMELRETALKNVEENIKQILSSVVDINKIKFEIVE